MVKKILLVFLVLSGSVSATMTEKRFSVLYLHRSVGNYYSTNCVLAPVPQTRLVTQDDTTYLKYDYVTFGDTLRARYVFRDCNLNGPLGLGLSDTVPNGCGKYQILPWGYATLPGTTSQFAWKIYGSGQLLMDAQGGIFKPSIMNAPENDGNSVWDAFRYHQLPTRTGGIVNEFYDLVIIKQPYSILLKDAQGVPFNPARINQMKASYRAFRDSVLNHPEIPCVVIQFTTPLRLNHSGDGYTVAEADTMRRAYDFCTWFMDTLIQEITYRPIRRNFFVIDGYRPLVQTEAGDHQWFMRPEYSIAWAPDSPLDQDGGSHPNNLGSKVGADHLVQNINLITRELLKQREYRGDHSSLYSCLSNGCSAPYRLHCDHLIALRANQGISGASTDIDTILKLNADFEWTRYISAGDGDLSEGDIPYIWLRDTMLSLGLNPEAILWYHYADATSVPNAAGGGQTCVGVKTPGATLADTIASRIRAYATTSTTRFLRRNNSDTSRFWWAQGVKKAMLNGQFGFSYAGVGWDNAGYRCSGTWGNVASGGHIAEVPMPGNIYPYQKIDSFTATFSSPPVNDTTYYWRANLRPFLVYIRQMFDTANLWMPNKKRLVSSINIAQYWPSRDDLVKAPAVAHYLSYEASPEPTEATASDFGASYFVDSLFYRDSIASTLGMGMKYNPQPTAIRTGNRGYITRAEHMMDCLCYYYAYAARRSSLAFMRGDASNGLDSAKGDRAAIRIYGERSLAPADYTTGVGNYSGRTKTTAFKDTTLVWAAGSGSTYLLKGLKPIIDEWKGLGSSATSDIGFMVEANTPTTSSYRQIAAFENTAQQEPRLHIFFKDGGTINDTVYEGVTTGARDATGQLASTTLDISSTNLTFGRDANALDHKSAFIFNDVRITPDDVIDSAELILTSSLGDFVTYIWDTLTWMPIMNFNVGPQHNTRAVLVVSGVNDPLNQPVRLYKRSYQNADVYYRSVYGSSSTFGAASAYTYTLPTPLKEIRVNGDTQTVSTVTFRMGQGRIFLSQNAISYTGSGGIPDPEPPTVNPVTNAGWDSLKNDFSVPYSQLDSLQFHYTTPADAGYEYVIVKWGTTTPTDTVGAQFYNAYTASQTVTQKFTGTVVEPTTIYATAWVLDVGVGLSPPLTFQVTFSRVLAPPAVVLDSFRNDYSGELDSVRARVTTGAQTFPDSVVVAISNTTYPASPTGAPIQRAYTANTLYTEYPTVSITEPGNAYVSAWVYDKDENVWSAAAQATRFYQGPPVVVAPLLIVIDSFRNDYAGDADSVKITITTTGQAGIDSLVLVASQTGFQPYTQTYQRFAYAYASTLVDTIAVQITEPSMFYVQAWAQEGGIYWSTPVQQTRYFDVPPLPNQKPRKHWPKPKGKVVNTGSEEQPPQP